MLDEDAGGQKKENYEDDLTERFPVQGKEVRVMKQARCRRAPIKVGGGEEKKWVTKKKGERYTETKL